MVYGEQTPLQHRIMRTVTNDGSFLSVRVPGDTETSLQATLAKMELRTVGWRLVEQYNYVEPIRGIGLISWCTYSEEGVVSPLDNFTSYKSDSVNRP